MKTYFLSGFTGVIMLFALFSIACSGEHGISIDDPWVREAPPNVKVLAAYMSIKNASSEQRILSSIASSAFESVEIHETVNHDGMMLMEHQPQLVIAAKSKVVLKPGSYHLMLMGPKKSFIAGDVVDLSLKFANGEEISIAAPVRKSK
jgi:copper(I)-binding protein